MSDAALRGLFEPGTVAVIGVSEGEDNLGRQISANLGRFGFDGIIYEVGPRGGQIFGRRIYRAVSDIPDHIDLAVILTPAATVPDILEECGRKGVRHAVIETAGFAEHGADGEALSRRLQAVAAEFGIRFVGPNCIGIINRHTGLCTPFVGLDPSVRGGAISLISQSGGVGISILNVLVSEGLGLAKLVSVGNKLDLDENDLLEFLIDDPETEIICMYLEGISDGRRLVELARRSTKPILVHKSNIGHAAERIASSHTGALSSDDAVVDAALHQAGIARFRDTETLVHYLKALPMPPLVGNRLAVLSRSGGHAVIAADECELTGFELAELPRAFLDEVEQRLRARVIRLTNPMDLGDLFDLDAYGEIAARTLAMDGVDGMVFLHTYVAERETPASLALFERLHALSRECNKPVAIHVATEFEELGRARRSLSGPIFSEPSDAVRALALLRDFGQQRVFPANRPDGPADVATVRAVFERCRREGRDPLLQEAMAVAAAYGIPFAPARIAQDEAAAVAAARDLGYPVAMKVIGAELSHKSDFGGVQLNLRSEAGLRRAWSDMMSAVARRAPSARIEGAMLQPMILGGRELIVGARRDDNFGHVVLVGAGGIFVEILRDVAMRLAPFDAETARDMIGSLRIHPVLEGRRGQAPADQDALVATILALVRLVDDVPEIAEIDLNPIRVMDAGQGCVALDARIRLGD